MARFKAFGNSMRREGEMICKAAGEKFWDGNGGGTLWEGSASTGTDDGLVRSV